MIIEINEKKIELKPIKYLEVFELNEIENRKEYVRKLFSLSGVPEDLINELNASDGMKINEAINDLNGWVKPGNFRQPSLSEENK